MPISVPSGTSGQANRPWQDVLQDELDAKRRRKRRRWLIVLLIALVVLVGSLAALGVIGYSYLQGQQKYGEIADKADFHPEQADEQAPLESIKVDWDALREANPDTVAWVYMPGTPINYPVVQGQDNEHYLYYDFDGEAGWLAEYGSIFFDCTNSPDFSDQANFIYGHHMNDGSMFAAVASLESQEAFDEHRIFYVLTPKGNFRLRSFSIVNCSAYDPIVQTDFAKKKELRQYVQDKIDRSLADPGKIPEAKDMGQIFALATCDDYSVGRDVLFGYVVDRSALGLEGEIGISGADDGKHFVDDLKESKD